MKPLPAPYGHSPLRRANSVRRTTHIDMTWPDGEEQPMHFVGCGRDVLTRAPQEPIDVLMQDDFTATVTMDRKIVSIESSCRRCDVSALTGFTGGAYLRAVLQERFPDEREAGTPLYLLLDDLSGSSLIAGWAFTQRPGYVDDFNIQVVEDTALRQTMMNVCLGFAEGSTSLSGELGSTTSERCAVVKSLVNPEDPDGWPVMAEYCETSMRRARRIDVWSEGNITRAEVYFQDTASRADGSRVAVHEYCLQAYIDAANGTLARLDANPHILPYPECPNAIANLERLIGTPVKELRTTVLKRLARAEGCTHLNDAVRSLAEVPVLANYLS